MVSLLWKAIWWFHTKKNIYLAYVATVLHKRNKNISPHGDFHKICIIISCVKAKEKKETDQMAINRQQTNHSMFIQQNSILQLA